MTSEIADPLRELSNKYARLDPDRRAAFRARLRTAQPDSALLPVVRLSDRTDRVPLSHAQERLWFLWRLEPESPAYNIIGAVRLQGELNVSALRMATSSLVMRHESLRTRFEDVDGTAWQVIEPEPVYGWAEHDLSTILDGAARDLVLQAELDRVAEEPFDLEKGPLLRVELFRQGEREHVLHFAMHHIVSDGWSNDILVREFAAFYQAALDGRKPNLPDLPIQYADYALWQREWLDEKALKDQLDYWKGRLGEEHPVLQLPVTTQPDEQQARGGRVTSDLPADVVEGLRALSRQHGATLFMTLLAVFDVLLYRYCNESDIRVAVPIAGRQRVETEGLIGFFVNTLVIRSDLHGGMTFGELLGQVRDRVLEAQANQDVPFERLVAELQPERAQGQTPLTRVKFLLRSERPGELSIANLHGRALPIADSEAHFDISLDATETPTSVKCRFSYNPSLLSSEFMTRFASTYVALAGSFAAEPSVYVGEVSLHTTPASLGIRMDGQSLLLDRVAAHGAELGSTVAASEGTESISWETLWSRAGHLAARLREARVSAEVPVGVKLPRSIDQLVSLLAIWRAGGVYVPLEYNAPPQRTAELLASAGIKVLISRAVEEAGSDAITLIHPTEEREGDVPDIQPVPSQAAYIIFTSGSTGVPKPVLISHGALADYLGAVLAVLPSGIHHAAYTSTPTADLGHTVLFGALYAGWHLHIVPEEVTADPDAFAVFMQENKIDVLKFAPTHLAALLESTAPENVIPHKCIVLGGEPTTKSLVQRIKTLRPTCQLLNHYGPTETTVGVLTRPGWDTPELSLLLGRPLRHVEVDLYDQDGNIVPDGAIGEICVVGSALARGYVGYAGQTAEKFIPAPSGPPGARLYRTGDKGQRLESGEIAFRGRLDEQVKIRGYRVEPGEIAHRLRSLPNVVDAVVTARVAENNETELNAYVVGQSLNAVELRQLLLDSLPAHLVPATIQVIDRIPIGSNGKVDRKRLPSPRVAEDAHHLEPETAAEKILLDIWQEVLERADFGVEADFFELGGDSIRGLKIVARAKKAGLPLKPNSLFDKRTIRELAHTFDQAAQRDQASKVAELSALLDSME